MRGKATGSLSTTKMAERRLGWHKWRNLGMSLEQLVGNSGIAVVRPSEQVRGQASSPLGWRKPRRARRLRPEPVEGRAAGARIAVVRQAHHWVGGVAAGRPLRGARKGLICRKHQAKGDETPMTYQAPVDDILHALKTAAGFDDLVERGLLDGVDEDTIRAVLAEAGKFGAEVLDPLSAPGDRVGSKLVDGKVVTPPGWKEA